MTDDKKELVANSRHTLHTKTFSTVLLLITSVSAGFLGGWLGAVSHAKNPGAFNGSNTQGRQVAENQSQLISGIAKQVGPSVVSIDVTSQARQMNIFGNTTAVQQQSSGTGFIISSDGYVITNRHVVPAGVNSVSVTLSDGTQLDNVEVVGRTNQADSLDIAVLKIRDAKGKKLNPVAFGDSSRMQVGDMVVAIGNALGEFRNTVTSGIISGFGRSVQAGDQANSAVIENLQNLFQTDAAINAGNSGGPLVNADGQVIGINTAIAGGAQNIGFAIPINDVQGLIKSVLSTGKLLRPYLGVRYVSLTDAIATQYHLSITRGAYLAPGTDGQPTILGNSPASKAGLQEKDIITKVNDQAIDENNNLTSVLGRHAVGDKVTLTIVRGGKQKTIQATLEAAPNQ